MSKNIRAETLKEVWELFNKKGLSVIPAPNDKTMRFTISYDDSPLGSITFSRPSAGGILCFLTDEEWMKLKNGKIPK